MLKEFKAFIARGNVMDLAVGVILGAAFGKIVTSLVEDILTPLLGIIMGGIDFSGLSFTIKDAVIKYGSFIQNIINFVIQAFCIFLMVLGIILVSLSMSKVGPYVWQILIMDVGTPYCFQNALHICSDARLDSI